VRRTPLVIALALSAATQPGLAQRPPLTAPCEDAAFLLTAAEQSYCYAIAQTVMAAQPLLGILSAQGEAAPGAGVRDATVRGVAATVSIGAAEVRLPDIRSQHTAATERLDLAAPALSATMSLQLFPGFTPAAGSAGVGSIRVIGSAAWLPFNAVDVDGLADDAAEFAWGAGVVVDLLGEAGMLPSLSLSLMRRRLGTVSYGAVCPAGAGADLVRGSGSGYDFVAGTCAAPADPGEFAFDLASWSGRAVVARRLAGVSLAAGAGYDRFRSGVDFGIGANPVLPGIGVQSVYARGSGLKLQQDRWSGFVSGGVAVRSARVVAEAGWLQGGNDVDGFDAAASAFDPARGALFGGFGVRLAF
jgi:hypothetical protein